MDSIQFEVCAEMIEKKRGNESDLILKIVVVAGKDVVCKRIADGCETARALPPLPRLRWL
jgi:hypothetical protein